MADKDQDVLGLGLSLASTAPHHRHRQHPSAALRLSLMPPAASPSAHHLHKSPSPWADLLAPPSGERRLRGIDVNRASAAERESEKEAGAGAGASSPNSTVSSVSGKRDLQGGGGEENDTERAGSRGISDEEDGEESRKKLRLSKDQSAILEESFKEHSTLNPKQKLALAKQLSLRPRQVEVWFQNRRARTKLKQTEVDCEFLKRCCENLTEENRRLQKEVQELRALKLSPQFYTRMTPPTTLTMCPSCERVSSSAAGAATSAQRHRPIAAAPVPCAPIPLRASFLDAAPPQRS